MESYPSGKGQVCKTSMQRFDSARLLKAACIASRFFLTSQTFYGRNVQNLIYFQKSVFLYAVRVAKKLYGHAIAS